METYKIVAFNHTHSFLFREVVPGIYDGISGFEYELLKILSKAMKFNFQLIKQSDGAWGHLNQDGQWTGMIGTLQRQEADMVVQMVAMSYQRSQVVDFAFPHAIDQASFVAKKAGEAAKDFVYLYPFQFPIWIGVAVSLLFCSFLFAMILHSTRCNSTIKTYLFSVITAFEILTGNRTFKNSCKKLSSKLLLSCNGLAMRFLTLCFTAVFLSFLMSPVMEPQIKTFKELAKASKKCQVKVTTVKNTIMHSILMDTTNQMSQDLSTYVRKYPEGYSSSGAENAVGSILKGFYFLDAARLSKLNAYEILGNENELYFSEDSLQMLALAIAFRKNFCCVDKFSKMIVKVHQSGISSKLFKDYLFRLRLASHHKTRNPQQAVRPLSIWDLRGIFLFSLVGLILAILVLIIEIMCWRLSTSVQ